MGSTKIKLLYEGVAITQGDDPERPGTHMLDVSGDLLSFDYTDNSEGKADDLQIRLVDREGLWRKEWRPQKGAKLHATILPAFGAGELVCGDFWIDEIEVEGPPSTAIIRAVSIPIGADIRGTRKTRAWEGVTFRQMAKQIADAAGLDLYYDGDTIEIERVDQHEESDLALLSRLGGDFGYSVKVSDGSLVLYDQELLEDADAVATVDVAKGDGMVLHWLIRSKTRALYRAARVLYRNPIRKFVAEALKQHPHKTPTAPVYVAPKKRGKQRRLTNAQKKARERARQERAEKSFDRKNDRYLDSLMRKTLEDERRETDAVEVDDVEFLFYPDGAPVVGSVLEIAKRVKDLDEAKRLAERSLRNANRHEVEASLDLVGDAAMRAGQNINIIGAGDFSGKYHVDWARHSQTGRQRYTTALQAHKVLFYR